MIKEIVAVMDLTPVNTALPSGGGGDRNQVF